MTSEVIASLHDRRPVIDLGRSPAESYTKCRIANIVLSVGSTAALIAVKISNLTQGKEWAETLLSMGIGMSTQHALQTVLPRHYAIKEQSFLADHDIEVFLIGTLIYGNTSPNSIEKKVLFSAFNILFGAGVSAFIHALVTRKVQEQQHHQPLRDNESEGEESQHYKIAFLQTQKAQLIYGITEILSGIGIIIAGSQYKKAKFMMGYGSYLAADGMAQLVSLGTYRWAKKIWDKYQTNGSTVYEDQHYPPQISSYKILVENALALGYLVPGIFLLIASVAQKEGYGFPAYASYVATGLFTGFSRETERLRFTEVPKKQLLEIKRVDTSRTTMEKVFHVGKWIFGTVGVGGFIGLGIAGFDTLSWKFKKPALIDQTTLSTLSVTLYGGYALARLAKKYSWDTVYFHSHYSQGIPIWNLYVMSLMKIGSLAISSESTLDQIIACTAWASLGMGLGFRSASRGEFISPRVMSAFSAALIGNFIGWELLNEED